MDEIADLETLLDRACGVAERLGSMPPARFQITKHQLRQPSLDRAERNAREWDAEVLRAWKDPETRAAVRAYAEATLGRRR